MLYCSLQRNFSLLSFGEEAEEEEEAAIQVTQALNELKLINIWKIPFRAAN